MKRPRKTYLVNEEDLETTDYNEPQENLFRGESIVEATNKVLDFKAFKKDQANALKEMKKKNSKSKKSAAITAKKISKKYKNLKKTKKTFLVNEEDLETIVYDDEPQEDLFKEESVLEAANKVLDFEEFEKQQENLLNKNKRKAIEKEEQLIEIIKVPKKRKQQNDKAAQLAAKKILKKYKNIRFR